MIIKVEDVWKSFLVRRERLGIKELVVSAPKLMRQRNSRYWALRGISLSVDKGECVGVIGRNGAGKSTFLSLLLGVMHPSKGKVTVMGKKTPLLELGAGFHPDLTGRENIVMNGVLLGHTEKEIHALMDEIIAFSGLGDFIELPIRTYSSGMNMRLAFSVAIHSDPEILLIDEILAVGDESFQKKSGKAITDLIKSGVTTVYVSHNMDAVRSICDRVIWLEKGEIRDQGEPAPVISAYIDAMSKQ